MKRENRSSRNLAISYYILTSGQDGTAPAPKQFPVAVRTIWADDRKNDERLSSQIRHVVAGHRGIRARATLPGIDCRPPKSVKRSREIGNFMIRNIQNIVHRSNNKAIYENNIPVYLRPAYARFGYGL
jgi:hypothetical protein